MNMQQQFKGHEVTKIERLEIISQDTLKAENTGYRKLLDISMMIRKQ